MALPGQNAVTPFVGGTPVFPNTVVTATPGSSAASVEWTDVADVTVTAPITVAAGTNTIGHATSGVTPGTYGDATHIPEVTVEADGHVTAVTVGAAVAPIASPAFTGTPTAPTAAPLTDNTQVATTAYADLAVGVEKTRALAAEALLAPLASPALTGTPTAPTAAADTNTTQIATTAFVDGQAGTATPIVDGTGAAGSSLRYSRQDHVHPTDTSRAPLASPALTGTPTSPTNGTNTDNTTQIATDAFVQAALALALTSGKISISKITSSPYTLLATDILVVNTLGVSGFPTIQLPAASAGVRIFFVVNASGSYGVDGGGALQMQRNGGSGGTDTLNGVNEAAFPLARNGHACAVVFSDGVSAWHSINSALDVVGAVGTFSGAGSLSLAGMTTTTTLKINGDFTESVNIQTIAGGTTQLLAAVTSSLGAVWQFINMSAVGGIIKLPASPTIGLIRKIQETGGTNNITVQTSAGGAVATIAASGSQGFLWNGAGWKLIAF